MLVGQLQKMGILDPSKQTKSAGSAKRRSTQLDFSNLPPLKSGGTVGFSAFRDNDRKNKVRKKSNGSPGDVMAEDSEEDDDDAEIVEKMDELDDKDPKSLLSPEDAKKQGELAEGVGRIKVSNYHTHTLTVANKLYQLKRQHSAEPLNSRKSPSSVGTPAPGTTPPETAQEPPIPLEISNTMFGSSKFPDESVIGSPLKKQRASIYDTDDGEMKRLLNKTGFQAPASNILGLAEAGQSAQTSLVKTEVEEEL